jgi:hypothetical protein
MAGGQLAPGGKGEPSHRRTAINSETKIRMIHKYGGGHSLSAIAHGVGFAVPSMNTVVKYPDTCIVLYNILIQFRIPTKLITPIKTC